MDLTISSTPCKLMLDFIQKLREGMRIMKIINNLINSWENPHIESQGGKKDNQNPNNKDDMPRNILYACMLFCSLTNTENIKNKMAEIKNEQFKFLNRCNK